MPQAFLDAEQHRSLVAAIGINHPVRMKTGTGESRGEEIAFLQAPQHRACQASQHAGGEQRRGRAVYRS